jgi:GAF domain-containing protein
VQAIAAEVDFDRLAPRLLQIALENAGAEHGGLDHRDRARSLAWTAGVGAAGRARARPASPSSASTDLPLSLRPLRAAHARKRRPRRAPRSPIRHGDDPYVARRRRARSPPAVQRSGRLVGVLVLDNSQVAGAFSAPRIAILRILASQAAIAIENARLVAGCATRSTSAGARRTDWHRPWPRSSGCAPKSRPRTRTCAAT